MANLQENWSVTPSSNGTADANVAMADGTLFGADHGAGRNIMARVAAFVKSLNGSISSGGSANAYTFTSPSGHAFTAYAAGMRIAFKANFTNTGAPTINVDGIGAKNIFLGGAAVPTGAIVSGQIYEVSYDGTQFQLVGNSQPYDADLTAISATGLAALAGHLYGLTLSNNGSDATNDIDIAAGTAIDGGNAKFLTLGSALTKQLDAAWAVGTNAGGLDTGSIANTTYHVWLIMRSDTGVVDVLFSTSASSPTMPANYDYKRRIGSILRESAAIVAFSQNGDEFLRSAPSLDVNTNNPGTSAVTPTLVVPTGITVDALISTNVVNSTPVGAYGLLTSPSQADTTPTASLTNFGQQIDARVSGSHRIRTNTSRQIRYRMAASDASLTVRIMTHGWIDTRGRLA